MSHAELRNAQTPDFERFSLRRFLEQLREAGDLVVHEGQVDLADIGANLEDVKKATLFKKTGPEGQPLAGNVAGSRERLALAFNTTIDGLLPEVLRRLGKAPETIEVSSSDAPVHQIILTGDDVDLTSLPVHLQHGLDGAPYISSSVDIAVDRNGLSNVGVRRLMLRGKTEAGVDLLSPSDLRAIYETEVRDGKSLPVAFVVGSHPIDQVAATMRIPIDEVGLIASLREVPLPLVKCVTNDLMVPADAEYILEGYLDENGYTESEGPYGEFLGYYGGVKKNPVFHCTAITKRSDAIFQTSTIAGKHLSVTDSSQLMALRTDVSVWRALESAIREPISVHTTTSSGGMYNVRISMRQRVPGEARNAIAAVFGSLANIKHVFIFDPDINVFSDSEVDWAFATRFQADRDLFVEGGFRTLPLDPSLDGKRLGAKAGFDCTMPMGMATSFETQIPHAPTYPGNKFPSIKAALKDGPKYFEELMAAVSSRDGREIVRELDVFRKAGTLERDDRGRWFVS